MGPLAMRRRNGLQLHLQHGPIDLLIEADGEREQAFTAVEARFGTILDELVGELVELRLPMTQTTAQPRSPIARRMHRATLPHAGQFVTRMAAVAGAVADEALATMRDRARLTRAFVNNGGDIALYLAPGASFAIQMASQDGAMLGRIDIDATQGIGGLATSGWRGRSHSFGIADSVTVLGKSAASADVAATLIANAVNLPDHPGIERRPAKELWPDSDLGDRLVTTHCPDLAPRDIDEALTIGAAAARTMLDQGHISAAALFLQGNMRIIGNAQCFQPLRRPHPARNIA